jgi:ribosomal protein S18 acetylase RimI-like enzyme
MAHVMVDSFLAGHRGQIPEEVWEWRRQNWTYEVSAQGWERTLRGIADGSSPQECVYLAETESGEIIGLAMAGVETGSTTAEVYALYVLPDHHRQGNGRRLVAAIAAHLAQWDVTALHIGVLKANAPARRFYEALGGQIVGEREVEDAGFQLPEVIYGWSDVGMLLSKAGSEHLTEAP